MMNLRYPIAKKFSFTILLLFIFSFISIVKVNALDNSGNIGNALIWNINDECMTAQDTNNMWKAVCREDTCIVEGTNFYRSHISYDELLGDENKPFFQWFTDHSMTRLEVYVNEFNSSVSNDRYMNKITELIIGKDIKDICDNAFLNAVELKNIYIYEKNIDLTNTGIGYSAESTPLDDIKIHGYKNSTAETYANENGFTFIPLDEPVTEVTTSATEEVITESTTTQPVTTDSVTQQSQSTVITDAASAKVNSTPKTGEKNIYGIIALGVSAAVLSVVSSKKKRNR